jgi:methylenetetrahydrofolate dehydrogenase (NADP+)/methenyltetrahydrofolate cyclohydrolase
MTASLIDGKQVAHQIKEDMKKRLSQHALKGMRPPGLAVLLLGHDPASAIYVQNKRAICAEIGIRSYDYDLPASTSEAELLAKISALNEQEDVDGILVQLPLPKHINTTKVIEHIHPNKDVDGFHPYNFGRLAQGNPFLRPCTPYGIIQLLQYYHLPLRGKHAVIVGSSQIVGRPMALELLLTKATVTLCHSATQQLEHHIKHADLVVVATGSYNLVKPSWLQAHQVIIDVGIHRRADGMIHGDIDFDEAKTRVQWITPVPGGVGPMTICTLLENTLLAANIR